MSDILRYKMSANKIKEALSEKIIGEVYVEYEFDPSVFGCILMIAIKEPTSASSKYFENPKWYYKVPLDQDIFHNYRDEDQSKFLSKIVDDVIGKYKEHVYKKYFFN